MDDAALVFVAKLDDQASAAARRLEDTMGSLGGPVDPIEAAVLMAAEGIEETEAAFDDAGAAIVDAGVAAGEAAGAGVVDGLDGVAGEAGEAGQEVGEELITEAEQSTNEAAPRLGTAMQAAVLGAVALAVGAAAGLYAIGDTFDAVSDGLRVGTGASGDALGELEAIVESIGRSVPADFETIGAAVGDLNTRLGLTGAPLETLASQVVELGRITGEDVDINSLTQALSVFGVEAGNESAVLDDLFRVSQATGVGVNELAGNIAGGSAALKPFGFTIGDSAALLGTLDKAGIDSGSTVSALQRGLVNFAQAGKDPRAALEEVIGGIEGFLAVGDTAGAIDVASQVFGTRGAAQFVNAVESGKLSLDDLMGAAGVTGDTILGLGEETSDAAESWQILRNNFLAEVGPYAEEAFGALGTALSEAVEYLPQLIDTGAGVIEWLNENKGAVLGVVAVMGTLMAVTAAHTAFLAVQAAGGLAAYVAQLGIVQTVTRVAAAVQWLWNAAMSANPIGIIVVAIAALVAGLIWFFTQTEAGQAIVEAVWGAIQTAMTAVSDWWTNTVVPAWNAGFEAVSGWLSDLGDWFADVWQGIRNAVDTAVAFVVAITRTQLNIWRTIIDTAVAVVRGVFAWFGELPGMLRGWFTQAAVAVAEKTGEVVAFVTGLPGRILSAIGNAGQMLYNVGRDVISGLWNGLQSMATWIRNKVTGLVSSILPGPVKDILGIASPSKLFRYYGQMTGEGLGLGLEDEASYVARQAGALADAVAAPMDAVSASLGGTGLGVTVSGATATSSVVEVRHVVELPDGTTGTYSAEEWARLIASDREASAVLEKAVRRQQQSNAARTLVAANG